MNENLKQPDQDPTEVNNIILNGSSSLAKQNPASSADSPYEETDVPYIAQPNKSIQQTSPSSEVDDGQETTPPSSSPSRSGGPAVLAAGIGALLGVVLSSMAGGNPLVWGGIGAVVGFGIMALFPVIFTDESAFWLPDVLGVLPDLSCCLTSAILIVTSIGVIGGIALVIVTS